MLLIYIYAIKKFSSLLYANLISASLSDIEMLGICRAIDNQLCPQVKENFKQVKNNIQIYHILWEKKQYPFDN